MYPTTLLDWCSRYVLTRGIRRPSAYLLCRTVRVFDEWLCRPSSVSDLVDETVSLWIQWMENRYSAQSRCTFRGHLLCLWRFIAEEKVCGWPGRIRKAPAPEPQPIAWTLDELRSMRQAATRATGVIVLTGVSRSDYFAVLIDVAYETGLRRRDLWSIEQRMISPSGIVSLRQHKTGGPHEPQVQKETLEQFRRLPGKHPLRWPGSARRFYRVWHKCVIEPSGARPGALQQIRRTGATHLESLNPAHTSRYLGHKTADMKRHYVDRSQAYGPAPMPPRFWWET